MSNQIVIPRPENFSFVHAVNGHGWSDLLPFEYDDAQAKLHYVYRSSQSGKPNSVIISEAGVTLKIETRTKGNGNEAIRNVRHVLRLDEDLDDFYSTIASHEMLSWVQKSQAGRLLRSHCVFEDLVKTMCTTNCSWALTKNMTTNLVEKIGEPADNGRHAFPTPQSMAGLPESFYRDEIRAGYRSPYFVELAEAVAGGRLDPESWLLSDLPTEELKKEIKKVKGIGDYAAENMLKLLGRYDGLALDSWLRAGFYKKYNREKVCSDKKIEKHYKQFGKWKGLAMWCDMTGDRS
ncbi:MAG: hypothetical protein ABIU09_02780 [Pyrinomonadaceae bacterium]